MVKSQFLTVRRAVVVTVVVASRERPTAHLAFARGGGDHASSRIIKKKSGRLPDQSKGTFWCGFVWAKTRLIRSTKKDVSSSSSSCLPCRDSGTSLRSTSSWLLCRRRRRFLRRWFYCAWCGASSSSTRFVFWDNFSERGSFPKNKNKKCAWFRV